MCSEVERKSLEGIFNNAMSEVTLQFKNTILEFNRNESFISNNDKEQWLLVIVTLREELNCIKKASIINEQESSRLLNEIQSFEKFLISFNDNLEKKILKDNLLRIKDQIIRGKEDFDLLFYNDKYFSKMEFNFWKLKWEHLIQPIDVAIKKGIMDIDFYGAAARLYNAYYEGDKWIEARNKEFVAKELNRYKDFFDTVESCPLTKEQREAIIIDEANTLIVAGAGSGKTSTIIGKAKYLVKKGLASPEEVLLIAFNKNVVKEMEDRLQKRFSVNIPVKTYHGLGLSIISESVGIMPSVSKLAYDRSLMPAKITDMLRNRMNEKVFAQLFNEYFLYYSSPCKSAFDFSSFKEYFDYLKRYDIRSLNGEQLRSFEECIIANFLYSNGIEYKYEAPYKINTADRNHPQYRPDFYLPKYEIYIEHFGINREGKTAPYVNQADYLRKMDWKRKIHAEYNTILIETYSYERSEGTLLANLMKNLSEKGVEFNPISQSVIFDKLNELARINRFSVLLANFLNLFKSGSNDIDQLRKSVPTWDRRTISFLDIFETIYNDYSAILKNSNEIDFNDMLNEASILTEQGKWLPKFKYVLVDEFQDISLSRYQLLKSLMNNCAGKLFCVGDDWQSIYRFTGSDLSIMVDFEKSFGFSETRFLQETFRLSDKLCNFSTKFILENPLQIRKQITSTRTQTTPPATIVRDDIQRALRVIFTELSAENQFADILIIGRYNWSKPDCLQEIIENYPQFNIRFCTAHRSKGLEADYVIILDLEGGEYGFPCQIVDDPLLSLVLAKDDLFRNAEERRLFYVAITRAKKKVFLLINKDGKTSSFIEEIQKMGYEYEFKGFSEKRTICNMCKIGEIIDIENPSKKITSSCNNPFCDNRLIPTLANSKEKKPDIEPNQIIPPRTQQITSAPVSGIMKSGEVDLINLATYFGRVEPGKYVKKNAETRLGEIGRELGFDPLVNQGIPNLLNDGYTRY